METASTLMAAAALACTIAACDGPKEKAGAAEDEAAANASGVPYEGNGPAEHAGRAVDRIDRAAAKARNSQADVVCLQELKAPDGRFPENSDPRVWL